MNNWFDDSLFDTEWMPRVNGTAPAVNVKETAEDYTMEVAVPGLKKEWVRMNIDADGYMNVAIENKMEHKDSDKHTHYLRREFAYSNYEQSYALPEDVDRDKISAQVKDGVLEIVMPKNVKKEDKDVKHIDVK